MSEGLVQLAPTHPTLRRDHTRFDHMLAGVRGEEDERWIYATFDTPEMHKPCFCHVAPIMPE